MRRELNNETILKQAASCFKRKGGCPLPRIFCDECFMRNILVEKVCTSVLALEEAERILLVNWCINQ